MLIVDTKLFIYWCGRMFVDPSSGAGGRSVVPCAIASSVSWCVVCLRAWWSMVVWALDHYRVFLLEKGGPQGVSLWYHYLFSNFSLFLLLHIPRKEVLWKKFFHLWVSFLWAYLILQYQRHLGTGVSFLWETWRHTSSHVLNIFRVDFFVYPPRCVHWGW